MELNGNFIEEAKVKYDITLKDKYGTGFGSTVKYIGKTEDEIAALLAHWNGLTPEIKNRWKVITKKEAK